MLPRQWNGHWVRIVLLHVFFLNISISCDRLAVGDLMPSSGTIFWHQVLFYFDWFNSGFVERRSLASNRGHWSSMGDTFLEQWTSYDRYHHDDDEELVAWSL